MSDFSKMAPSNSGYLGIILGPMFSGKTTRLIQLYKTRSYIGKKIVVINYSGDTRYHETMLSTHDRIMIPCLFVENLREMWENPENPHWKEIHEADTILINEGQFFKHLFHSVLEMVEKERKEVFICGLDGDFKRSVFGELLQLIPYCDSVEKLNSLCANCRDGTPGLFSHRISSEEAQIVVGSDNYQPLCRNCYNSNNMG
jgi:thymidine kinase